ncbi:MAG TPA: DUF4105 domain-containing protein, partial [Candidatus Ozemobacteraceae bacterium]|nr:DUF4105 domain-containing protein [Candidatus Ozemobacteraceae bacterium]
VQENVPTVRTEDGRVFMLVLDLDKAREMESKTVRIEGKAHKADDVELIKVQKINVIPDHEFPAPKVEHADYQKPASILSQTADQIVIKDVRWGIQQDPATSTLKAKHEWETVTIKPDLVENGYFVLKPFAPKFIAAHSLFVFTFKPGGMVSKTGKESKAIALTIEAYKKVGQTYGLIKTMKKVFDIVWNLTTWENYMTLTTKFNTGDTELFVYPMTLTREQTKALLVETIKQSCVNRQGEYYHTIFNNCTNNLVILANRVLPKEKRIRLWAIPNMIYNFKATMPLSLAKKLKKLDLIGDPLPKVTAKNMTVDLDAAR